MWFKSFEINQPQTYLRFVDAMWFFFFMFFKFCQLELHDKTRLAFGSQYQTYWKQAYPSSILKFDVYRFVANSSQMTRTSTNSTVLKLLQMSKQLKQCNLWVVWCVMVLMLDECEVLWYVIIPSHALLSFYFVVWLSISFES